MEEHMGSHGRAAGRGRCVLECFPPGEFVRRDNHNLPSLMVQGLFWLYTPFFHFRRECVGVYT